MVSLRSLTTDLVTELESVCGARHVLTNEFARNSHSRTTEPESRRCGAIVYPGSAEEVSAILRVAARRGVPVWPFSRGNNWGYGTKNALESDAIILVLERMNRIIEVNDELAYAVIEPGVTQRQLYEHLRVEHPRLISDCTDSTPLGSVLGNAIERGYGYTPYGDHFGHLCGLEVVLPSGELLRLGDPEGSCPTWSTHKWGYGPSLEGLFSQSNFGVVVKGGVWLCPRPEKLMLFTLDVERTENLPAAINALRKLALNGTLQSHVHTANAYQTLSLLQKYPADLLDKGMPIPKERLAELKSHYGLPEWTAVGGIYGSVGQVRIRQRDIKRALELPGTTLAFFDEKKVAQAARLVRLWQRSKGAGVLGVLAKAVKTMVTRKDFALVALLPEMYGILHGKPTWSVLRSAYFKSRLSPSMEDLDPARDGCGLMWLALAVPMTGSHAMSVHDLAERLFTSFGLNMSACFTMMNERTMFFLLGVFFDQENNAERNRAAQLYQALYETFSKHGYQHYRSGIPAWTFGRGSQSPVARLLEQLKAAVDPAGILAPGRYHIQSDTYR